VCSMWWEAIGRPTRTRFKTSPTDVRWGVPVITLGF
jgi:hypothetical protein